MTDEDYGKINLAEYFVKKTDLVNATTIQDGLMSATDKIKLDNLKVTINWNDIENKPDKFIPSTHTHQKSDITDFNHSHGDIDENGVINNGNNGDILILGIGNRITSSASIDASKIQNLKTINNESIVGSGNININAGNENINIVTSWNTTTSDSKVPSEKLVKTALDNKAPNIHTHDDYDIQLTNSIFEDEWGATNQYHFNTATYDIITSLQTDKINISDIANNLTTTTSGKVLDARQGKELADNKADSIHTHNVSDINDFPTIPSKTSDLTNDSGFLTSHQSLKTINNESIVGTGNITITGGSNITVDSALSSISENPVQNQAIYSALENKASNTVATSSANGLMSATDKNKLDGMTTTSFTINYTDGTSETINIYKQNTS